MGFHKYEDAKLIQTANRMKTITIVFGIIWLILITFLIGIQIYSVEKGNFQFATLVPILVGPMAMPPIYVNYQNFKKEIKRREL